MLYYNKDIEEDSINYNKGIEYNDDNSNHPFVSLQHVILRVIVSKLDNIIDGILFSLICKRFYQEREKYLIFNLDNLLLRIDKTAPDMHSIISDESIFNTKFKSYQSIINNSINLKSNATLIISNVREKEVYGNVYVPVETIKTTQFLKLFDYYANSKKDIKTILSEKSISTVVITKASGEMVDYVLNLLLDYESVTSLIIKSSTVVIGSVISRHIKKLELNDIGTAIPNRYFPPNLESLTLGPSYPIISDPSELPTTLKYLKLDMKYNNPFERQQLPPNLEELHFDLYYTHTIDNDMIPQSLHTITNVGFISNLERNQSLRKLKLCTVTPLSSIVIPPTLQDLSIQFHQDDLLVYPPIKFIPPTLVSLSLFMTSSEYKSTHLVLKNIFIDQDNSKLKSLKLETSCHVWFSEETFPEGLETLDLQNVSLEGTLEKNYIKQGIKNLVLPPHNKFQDQFLTYDSIPESVESLTLPHIAHELMGEIPEFVKHIRLPWNFAYYNRFNSLIGGPFDLFFIETITFNTASDINQIYFRKLDEKHFIIFYLLNDHLCLKYSGIARIKDLGRFWNLN